MEIVVHYPETEEGKKRLEERVADLHSQLIVSYIEKLPWDGYRKALLFDEVKKAIKSRADKEKQSLS